jgi:death-on-curing protein
VRFDDIVFLEEGDLIRIHDEALLAYGGTNGVRDHGAVAAAAARPSSGFGAQLAFDTLAKMACSYVDSMVSSHPFSDGNKRTGYQAMVAFLAMNGFPLAEDDSFPDRVLAIAEHTATTDDLVAFVASLMGGDEAVEG